MWMRTAISVVPALALCVALSVRDTSMTAQTPHQGPSTQKPPAPITPTGRTPAPAPTPPARATTAAMNDVQALAEFEKQTTAYVNWRKSTAGTLGATLTQTASPAEIAARETALGTHIRKARNQARQGDIFNANAAAVFRRVITADYRARTAQKKRLQQDDVPTFAMTLNQTYPSQFPLATFPATLLAKLPKLPEQVEYRLVGTHLILRDTEANVIVDYVPNVIP
jgi:hypothetical protein